MTWSTEDEIRFINGLGMHRDQKLLNVTEILRLLRSYRDGINLRVVWTGINRSEVEAHTDKRIKHYERQLSNAV